MMRRSQVPSKLLRIVKGKCHATHADHADDQSHPSPPADESIESSGSIMDGNDRDWDREPDSSSDGGVQDREVEYVRSATAHCLDQGTTSTRAALDRFGLQSSQGSTGIKDSNVDTRRNDQDNDDETPTSQGWSKQRDHDASIVDSQDETASIPNLLARTPRSSVKNRRKTVYGKKSETSSAPPGFKRTRAVLEPHKRGQVAKKLTGLSKLSSRALEMTREESLGSEDRSSEADTVLRIATDTFERLPDLGTQCGLCGEVVDSLAREEFQDSHCDRLQGQHFSYQWQKRFCHFHKQRTAEWKWDTQGYPKIDWNRLERRMRQYDDDLREILSDTSSSTYYRAELKSRLQPGSKGIKQSFNLNGPTVSVGYYGPRGQKLMTDHILTNLSDDIRKWAPKDKLVRESGASGGVTGFVQAVLVPHLAECLVQEDMNLGDIFDRSERARKILVESIELGELLNPEAEDQVEEEAEEV